MFKICLGNRKNVYLLKMKIGQGQNLYSHLVLRFTFFCITTRSGAIGKELKGGGQVMRRGHKRRKMKMQKKSDLQISIQKQKKREL